MKTKINHKGRGRRKEQRRRRKLAHKIISPQPIQYELIDGNYSAYIVGFCKARQNWLTFGLAETHHCWDCMGFKAGM